jgi:hypothetical protein
MVVVVLAATFVAFAIAVASVFFVNRGAVSSYRCGHEISQADVFGFEHYDFVPSYFVFYVDVVVMP